jgi:phosphate transport system substrate-binding protein
MRWRKDTLRSTKRPLIALVGLLSALTLVVAACSSDDSSTETGGTSGGSGTTVPGSDIDFEALSGTLNGSGATFPKAFYDECIASLEEVAPNLTVNYPTPPGGSGKGKQDLADQVTQWGATDSLVKDEDKAGFKGGEFLYFPTVAAPITVSFNLSGVDTLDLTPETLAKIFQGEITTWNDPAIAADNSGVDLPSTAIVVVHRSDGSGTTSNFTKYLDAAAEGTWTLGSGDTVNWPANTQAGNGNTGVAQIVKDTSGAIGYVDFSDATATGLSFAAIKNKDGNFVEASLEGASAALAGAEIKPDLTYSALDAAGADSYPITAGTYIIVYVNQPDASTAENLQGWISYVLTDCQNLAEDVDFAPLPASLQEKALAQVSEITAG